MKPSASVLFRNALAHYTISQEEEGVFLAQLIDYEGKPDYAPPVQILLTRGIRRWIGSFDNQEVLDALGQAIDTADRDMLSFSTVQVPESAQLERQPAGNS